MPPVVIAFLLALSGAVSAPAVPAVAAAAAPLAGKVIVIDPGHQLGNARHRAQIGRSVSIGAGRRRACNTTGTSTARGFPEATFTWRVAVQMRKQLQALGARVVMTRDANSAKAWGPCVDVRGRRGNAVHADAKVSIHGDGSFARGAHGFHVIYAPDRRPTADTFSASRRLALTTRAALGQAGFARATYLAGGDGLDARADLGTLNLSHMPTVMVECGNMRDAGDARRMSSAAGQKRYASALATGVAAFLSGS